MGGGIVRIFYFNHNSSTYVVIASTLTIVSSTVFAVHVATTRTGFSRAKFGVVTSRGRTGKVGITSNTAVIVPLLKSIVGVFPQFPSLSTSSSSSSDTSSKVSSYASFHNLIKEVRNIRFLDDYCFFIFTGMLYFLFFLCILIRLHLEVSD